MRKSTGMRLIYATIMRIFKSYMPYFADTLKTKLL